MRKWLNEDFLESSFDAKEKNAIIKSNDENSAEKENEDYIFILSETEVLNEKFGFNTAISALMELINEMYKYKELDSRNEAVIKEGVETIVTILAPFAPHIGEELWAMIGKEGSIFNISWPKYDETALVKDEVEIVVQINGKVRGKLSVAANISREEMEKVAMEDEKIKALVEGKTIVKVVAVPKKLVNIVVK